MINKFVSHQQIDVIADDVLYKFPQLVPCMLQKVEGQELILVVPHRTHFGCLTHAIKCLQDIILNTYKGSLLLSRLRGFGEAAGIWHA